MAPISVNLFRSESSSSLGSSSDEPLSNALNTSPTGTTTTKRSRKRFTGTQLTMLEQLFHRTSHPSREERESLAQELELEPKVVTIWFQNRRQNERKASLNASIAASEPTFPVVVRTTIRKCKTRASTQHTLLPSPYSHPSPPPQGPLTTSLTRRPTLETMARRSELRTAPSRTPTKRPDKTKSLWDNMPSSPLAPPSPPEQEFVQFGMEMRNHTRSLEWACAAARLVGKRSGSAAPPRRDEADDDDDDDETDEEEVHEAVTPKASLIREGDTGSNIFWGARNVPAKTVANQEKPKNPENELMDAALLLCGLGRTVA